jgi:hypothetical protein
VVDRLLDADATIASVQSIGGQERAEYIRCVLANFRQVHNPQSAVVRIGIDGKKGTNPNYKIEFYGLDGVLAEKIFHGQGRHKEMTHLEASHLRLTHWSSKVMTYVEVQNLLGAARKIARG